MITRDLQTAQVLVNKLINEILNRWASDSHSKIYMIRHTENSNNNQIVIQPTHGDTFHGIEDFIHVAEVCGCGLWIDCEKNQDGILTPTLHIY